MHLLPLPALVDNYIWLLHDDGQALVVDPGESAPVERALAAHGCQLRAILLTHHHADHIGGVAGLLARHPVPVYAPDDPRIDCATVRVADGDHIRLAALPKLDLEVMAVPGHTRSHVAYWGDGVLFAGDTLFSLGCGRVFEGTPAQMLASLDRLAALPGTTQLCCAHEYTLANGRFAHAVEPHNPELAARLEQVGQLRDQRLPSLPVPLADELATNPFLRTDVPAVIDWCRRQNLPSADRIARFACLRTAKDAFHA